MAKPRSKPSPLLRTSPLSVSPPPSPLSPSEPSAVSPPSWNTTPQEEIPTPYPHPARAVFGFALHIVGWLALSAYFVWLWFPTPYLTYLGITYVPAKLWAVLVPLCFFVLLFLFVGGVFVRNCIVLHGVFDDIQLLPAVSRSAKVAEVHRRLAEFERTELEREKEGGGNDGRETLLRVESEAAERMMRANATTYSSVFSAREKVAEERVERVKEREKKETEEEAAFPFRADSVDEILREQEPGPSSSKGEHLSRADHGFFVSGDVYVDEYTAATTADLPEDEMTVSSREVYGDYDDAVEAIDFQMPGQSLEEAHSHSRSVEEGVEYGDEDEGHGGVGTSDRKCGGCGAHFHCVDDSLPGYLPPLLFAREEQKARQAKGDPSLCKRCHLVKNHRFLPNVNVCPVDYAEMLSKLRGRQEVLILLVVDILDMPGSIHRALPDIIGRGKPMVVVANKVDLLPPDARIGYLKRFKQAVEAAITEAGFHSSFNILHTALVSAKTGYGVEDLITELHLKWTNVTSRMRDDIYLVGSTNAGKSTLFNSLLASDLCKVRAVDLVERATTSVWPGTTLSLLKFPVMRPSPFKLELRRRRLLAHKAWLQKEAYVRRQTLQQTGDSNMAVLVEPVINTYKEQEEELQPRAVVSLHSATAMDEEEGEECEGTLVGGGERKKRPGRTWSLTDPVFAKGVWCYDTPGTVNQEQLLDALSLRELISVVPSRLLRPRTAILVPGRSLLIGGIARLDIVRTQRVRPVYVTVFANDNLPLNSMATERVDEFWEKNRGREALGAPLGDSSRLSQLPPMEGKTFELLDPDTEENQPWRRPKERESNLVGKGDVIFSSIGWAMISTHAGAVEVSASLPGGRGLCLRQPPILPFSVSLRGPRIPDTDFYKVRAPEFPVNERRLKADANRRKYGRKSRKQGQDE